MKYLKITFAVLLIAIITDSVLSFASVKPILVSVTLNKQEPYVIKEWEKETWATQEYEHSSSITDLTNPCTNCTISARIWNSSNDWSAATLTKMGQKTPIARTTHKSPGKYKLKIERADFTLLKTYHVATWHLD